MVSCGSFKSKIDGIDKEMEERKRVDGKSKFRHEKQNKTKKESQRNINIKNHQASLLFFALCPTCLLTAAATVGTGVGKTLSPSRLATVFVGLTCKILEAVPFALPLAVFLALLTTGTELARLSAEPPIAVGC